VPVSAGTLAHIQCYLDTFTALAGANQWK